MKQVIGHKRGIRVDEITVETHWWFYFLTLNLGISITRAGTYAANPAAIGLRWNGIADIRLQLT